MTNKKFCYRSTLVVHTQRRGPPMHGYKIAFVYGPLGDADEADGADAVWAGAADPRWHDTGGRAERVTFAVDGSELQPILAAFLAHSRASWRLSISPC